MSSLLLILFSSAAWAHGGASQPAAWPWAPDILAATAIAAALYVAGWRRRRNRAGAASAWRHASFAAGLTALLAALQSPIDTLAEHSFAVHQLQHLLLRGVAPMLLFLAIPQGTMVAGMPEVLRTRLVAPLLRSRVLHALAVVFAHPLAATLWMIAVPVAWHLPVLHDRAVLDEPVHYLMHVTMLASALVFFWRVLDPRPGPFGASYATRIVMCWAAIAGTVPLGAYLALKSTVLYSAYEMKGRLAGLGALQDEQLGGIVIWLPGSMMFVVLLLVVIRQWGAREQRGETLRRRGIGAAEMPLDRRAANRALGLRLAGIAGLAAAAVAATALLERLLR